MRGVGRGILEKMRFPRMESKMSTYVKAVKNTLPLLILANEPPSP